MDRLKMHTENKVDINIEKVGSLFPNTLTEKIKGYDENNKPIIEKAIDFDILKQELSKVIVEGREERYQMNWPGKKEAILTANAPINKTLRPYREDKESVDFDNTENLYIEGDNLEVLKLLQETYLNKIKMIYIDPPYNTGKDSFVYNDKFSMSNEEFSEVSGQYDEDGNMNYDIRKNNESNGRFHTDWLNMMYPRLKLARDLLTEDGVIFISIDEKEVTNLSKICDEIFGKENYIQTFHIQVRYTNKSLNEDNDFQPVMEYILLYTKNKLLFKPNKPSEPYDLSKFIYSFDELTQGETIKIGNKTVTIFKAGEWKCTKHTAGEIGLLKETWASGSLVNQSGTAAEFLSKYLIDRKSVDGLGVLYKIHNMGEDGLGYRYVTGPNKPEAIRGKFYSGVPLERIKEIQNGISVKYRPIVNYYDYSSDFGNIRHEGNVSFNSGKKPIKMMLNLMKMANLESHDTIMDFFSGSATTAHAVMQLNAEDGGKRKFIMVQLPEETDEKSEARKAGYENICEIGKARIRKAGKKIKEENPYIADKLDTGFRVLKLDSSNMKDVYYNPSDYNQDMIEALESNIKEDRSNEDLLFQVMLDLGELLSSDIKEIDIEGKKVFNVGDGNIVACFDKDINNEILTEIAKMQPFYAIFRDSSLSNDSIVTNFEQIFKTYSPNTITKVL